MTTARPPLHPVLILGALLALVGACGSSGPGVPGTPPPSNLSYATDPGLYRAGEVIADNVPTVTGTVLAYTVTPALPDGLVLDPSTGVISGTPTTKTPGAPFTVTATNAGGSTQTVITVAIGAALPAAFQTLADGFEVEIVHQDVGPTAPKIARVAMAGDGRLFFVEVGVLDGVSGRTYGRVRVIDPVGGLVVAPYIEIEVLPGGHAGLLGLALAPDFDTSQTPYVYVLATVPGDGSTTVDRTVIYRYTDDALNNVGTNQQVVLDDLPFSGINNGGELVFERNSSYLFVSLGDSENSLNAQAPAGTSLAGKLLRIDPTIPATVPPENTSLTFEYVKGLRNTFGVTVHPNTGGVFAGDNGGMEMSTGFEMVDELNFISEGKNFEWGAPDGTIPGAQRGFTIFDWPAVTIVPTGIAWHLGPGFSVPDPNGTDSLLMTSYLDFKLRRFVMSGISRADIDFQEEWAVLTDTQDNNPLDVFVDGATNDIYVSTFEAIFRISAIQ